MADTLLPDPSGCASHRHREVIEMPLYRLGKLEPQVDPDAYVHEAAVLIGAVRVGARASVWPGAVLRADNDTISIGADTNIQDGCVLHADPGIPLTIGAGVSVGHQSMLHGCTIGDGSLIGIQSVLLNHCVIGPRCLVGAGALVTERKRFEEEGSMIIGAPARALRPLRPEEIEMLALNAASYVRRAALFRAELQRIG
jgi:carbonic anhydrase/acetyltransferase-like protein (isoleucine patch superfamily)